MSIDSLKTQIPDYAKDIKLNLSSLVQDETLTPQQLWGCFLSAALTCQNKTVISEIEEEAVRNLSPEALQAVKSAVAIMGMNNIYYKFLGLMGDSYKGMPSKLRMNILANPGVEKTDFELWSLVISVINGCGTCVTSHEAQLRERGVSQEQILVSIRIGAIINSVSTILQ